MRVKQIFTGFLILWFLVLFASTVHAVEGAFFIGTGGATEDKPQSKLWFNAGTWWAILPDGTGVYFHKLDSSGFVKQTFADAKVDTSNSARADVLWNGTHLFVLMYRTSTAKLSKYSYNPLTQSYIRLPGFPVSLPLTSGAETATLAQDSTGKLWVVYDPGTQIRILWSTNPEHTAWDPTGFVVYEPVATDDLAAVVAFDNRIGVMWSNQSLDNFGFRVHVDGQSETSWEAAEVVAQGDHLADDHLHLTLTTAQDILATVKTSQGNGIELFVRWHDSGWDGPYFISNNATRPIVLFDQSNEDVYTFYTGDFVGSAPTPIVYKKAKLSSLIDLTLNGSVSFLTANVDLNDVTSTKQVVDATTGIVVVAKGTDHAYYKSLDLTSGNLSPVASVGASVTSGPAPLTVQFTGSGIDPDGTIVGYTWTFGDGGTDTAQSPVHTYTATGTYSAQLRVTDNAGATGQATVAITVTGSTPVNQPPVVNAGPDQTLTLPASATLAGAVSDDGLPTSPGTVTKVWSKISGPGTVTFANFQTASTTATFSTAGTYILRLTTTDGALTASDDVTITVAASSSANQPPVVDAGPDQIIAFSANAALVGTVSDDSLPTGTLTLIWSQVSGPGTVTFTNPAAAVTTATFSDMGTYVLRLTATDGALQATDDLTVIVEAAGTTTVVETRIVASANDADESASGSVKLTSSSLGLGDKTAGLRFPLAVPQGATIVRAYVQFRVQERGSDPTTLTIEGEAGDNVLPFTTKSWSITSRPRTLTTVTWAVPAWPTAGVVGLDQRTPDLSTILQEIIDRPGWAVGQALGFVLSGSGSRRATTYDSSPTGAALLHVEYTQGPAVNHPAVVHAGPDQMLTFPQGTTLTGTVSDDGLPSGTLTLAWSQVSGPGSVTFTNPAAATTTATFSSTGTYVLRLTADDNALQASDELTVLVNVAPTNQPPVVTVGADQTIVLPNGASLQGTVSDDGLSDGVLSLVWSQVSGPEAVTFADPAVATTMATFPSAGTYVLRLTADDGALQASDELVVTVQAAGSTTVVELRIAASADDATESSTGSVKLTDSNLNFSGKILGLRFPLAVPQGATIVQAYVQFTSEEGNTVPTTVTIEGEDNDSASPFVAKTRNITNRFRTLAVVPWSPPVWVGGGVAGPDQRTPDLSAVIQEIVDRPGWVSGQGLGLILTTSGNRHALSYNGNQTAAPLLHVEYTLAPASN